MNWRTPVLYKKTHQYWEMLTIRVFLGFLKYFCLHKHAKHVNFGYLFRVLYVRFNLIRIFLLIYLWDIQVVVKYSKLTEHTIFTKY